MARSKKELDKDLMFEKILPALNDNPFSASETPKAVPMPEAVIEVVDENLSALRNKLFARSPDYVESETVATINIMENLVLRHVDTVMQRFNVCKCDRCRCDVTACALNRLPPKYVVAQSAKIEKAEKEIPINNVMDALIKAVIQVRSHPRH